MKYSFPRKQLTLFQSLTLIAGSTVGPLMVRAAVLNDAPRDDPLIWIAAVYATLAGVNMAGLVLMLADRFRFRSRRRWGIGAIVCFANGLLAWYHVPRIAAIMIAQSGRFGALGSFLIAQHFLWNDRRSIDDSYFIGWPIASLTLIIAWAAGGGFKRHVFRRWWPEWFGLIYLVVWALPGAYWIFVHPFIR